MFKIGKITQKNSKHNFETFMKSYDSRKWNLFGPGNKFITEKRPQLNGSNRFCSVRKHLQTQWLQLRTQGRCVSVVLVLGSCAARDLAGVHG